MRGPSAGFLVYLLPVLLGVASAASAQAEARPAITVAAASDLKFAMDEVVAQFKETHPGGEVVVVYGSSGKFQTQVQQGAPFDLYFSADIAYPRALAAAGLAASEVRP